MKAHGHWSRAGTLLALLAFLAALLAGGRLATAESWGLSSGGSMSIDATGSTVVSTWENRAERNLSNERVMKFWAAVLVGLTFASLLAALRGLTPLVWLVAVLLTILSILGLWTIGLLIAPVALLLLLAAVCLTTAKRRPSPI